jgi:ribosome modulation factor
MEAPLSDSILRAVYRGYKNGAINYRKNTCVYNSAMDFASMEVRINHHLKMVHSVSGHASIFTICSHYLSKQGK